MEYHEIDKILDKKIKALQRELKQLKRAQRTRRAKARARYPIRTYITHG